MLVREQVKYYTDSFGRGGYSRDPEPRWEISGESMIERCHLGSQREIGQ
ncbi:MAG: hypothetical protein ABIV27_05430 [Gemmatimonadales bacterium]